MITDIKKFPPFKHVLPPFKHQADDLERSKDMKCFALFHEMGCGKSKILLDTIQSLYLKGEIDGALIVSDKGCYRDWERGHIPTHWPQHIPHRMFTWSNALKQKDRAKMESILQAKDDVFDFAVINIDALVTINGAIFVRKFLSGHYAMMAVDESTSIKNSKAQRAKAAISLGQLAEYRRIMTGTPITQNLLDLYSQFEFLQPRLLGFSTFTAFRSQFAVMREVIMGPRRFLQIVGFTNEPLLTELILPWSSRRLKKDCLDLPEKIYETTFVDHTPEQAELYHNIKEMAVAQINQQLITVDSALTTIGKLHQINCGHIKSDDGEIVRIPNNRVQTLVDLLHVIPGKVTIWAHFQEDIRTLEERLFEEFGSKSAVTYYGKTTDKERAIALQRFGRDDTCRFWIGNPASGGKGINDLVVSSDVIYYSSSWQLEHRLQSEDRNHRPGQKNNVTYTDLVCPGTVDEDIVDAHKCKKNLAENVLADLLKILTR